MANEERPQDARSDRRFDLGAPGFLEEEADIPEVIRYLLTTRPQLGRELLETYKKLKKGQLSSEGKPDATAAPAQQPPGGGLGAAVPVERKPNAAPAPVQEPRPSHWGFWRGQNGAWLEFDWVSSETHSHFNDSVAHFGRRPTFEVTGTALQQNVHGYGIRTQNDLKLHLWLLSRQSWVDLDLSLVATVSPDATFSLVRAVGTAQSPAGETIPVILDQVAADLRGTWVADDATSLHFSNGRLEWNEAEQEVRGESWGTLFGRSGNGDFHFYGGPLPTLKISVSLDATDRGYLRRWCRQSNLPGWDDMPDWQLDHQYGKRFRAIAPRESWWGANSVLLHLSVSADHRTLDGKAVAIGHEYKREAPVHLTYRPASTSKPGSF